MPKPNVTQQGIYRFGGERTRGNNQHLNEEKREPMNPEQPPTFVCTTLHQWLGCPSLHVTQVRPVVHASVSCSVCISKCVMDT